MQPTHRILDVEQLSKSIRRRIRGLQNDEEPVSLGLPAEASALDALHQLQRLHKLWCEGAPPRPPAKVPDETTAGLAFGVNEIHFFVTGGKVFEQPDKTRELTRQEKNDIAMFGRVSERTQSMMMGELNFTRGELGRDRRDARRLAPAAPADRLQGRRDRPPRGDAPGRHRAVLPRRDQRAGAGDRRARS